MSAVGICIAASIGCGAFRTQADITTPPHFKPLASPSRAMPTNPYFAYSIKRDFVAPPATPPPRKKTRACDVCSIRKIKCDNARPCQHCVNNNLECTELRQRKKSGPKSLRQKTMDLIRSLELLLSSQEDLSNGFEPDLGVLGELAIVPPQSLALSVPCTVSSMTEFSFARPVDLLSNAQKFAVCTYAVLVVDLHAHRFPNFNTVLERLQTVVAYFSTVCDFTVEAHADFDFHYHMALANFHMFVHGLQSDGWDSRRFLRLRTSISHCQILEPTEERHLHLIIELQRTLYVWERHAYHFADPVFKRAGVLIAPVSVASGDLLTALCDLYSSPHLSHNSRVLGQANYHRFKENIAGSSTHGTQRRVVLIIFHLLRFKLLLDTIAYMTPSQILEEHLDILSNITAVFEPQDELFVGQLVAFGVKSSLKNIRDYVSLIPQGTLTDHSEQEIGRFLLLCDWISPRSSDVSA